MATEKDYMAGNAARLHKLTASEKRLAKLSSDGNWYILDIWGEDPWFFDPVFPTNAFSDACLLLNMRPLMRIWED